MIRVQALVPIACLVACGCMRELRPEATPADPSPRAYVAMETPRWSVIPIEVGERPDVLVVDWGTESPTLARHDWATTRRLVLDGAPREASFRVFRRSHFEWLVPGDLDVAPEEQVVGFLGGAARDIDVRYGRLELSAAELTGTGNLVERLQSAALSRSETGSLVTR